MLRGDPEIAAAIAEGAALAIVPLLRDAGRPAKANLSIDAGLLAAIDEAAEARGLTRSAFLATAAREKIESGGSSCLSLGSKARANGPAAGPVEGVTSTPDGRFPVSPTWKPREFWTDSVNARALLYSRA
jgi:hypothetical protein